MEWFGPIESLATVGALVAVLWQLRQSVNDGRRRDEDHRVERALTLHEQLVAEGATQEGFHRLSVLLRRLGTAECGTSTWHVLSDTDLERGGCLDPHREDREQAFADLYAVMWYFERCQLALDRHLVSEDVLMSTVGFHFWWWGQLLRNLRGPKATQSVARLAEIARGWSANAGVIGDWHNRCATDFQGGPAIYRQEP